VGLTSSLPPASTNALREPLSSHVPDDFIATLCLHDVAGSGVYARRQAYAMGSRDNWA